MSGSNNNVTVRYSVDASGAQAGIGQLRAANAQLNASQEEVRRKQEAVQRAMQEAATNGYNLTAREAKKLVDQYDRLQATAGKTRLEMLNQQAAARGVTQAFATQTAAIEKAAKAAHSFSLNNSAARREMLVLAHEASQNQWKRFAGSMLVMAEASDALSLIMSPLGMGLTAAAGAAFLFAKQVYAGYESVQQFNKAITATGGYLGLSTEQMLAWSNRLQDGHTALSTIRETMAQVAATGAVLGDDLGLATKAALAMSEDIGIGTDKAAESLAKIQDDVIKWVTEYQKAHHTFSAAQIEEIDNFVKQGDSASAVRAVMRDLASAHEKVAADADRNMGSVLRWWRDWGAIIDRVKGSIMNIGVPSTLTQQIGDQLAKVEQLQGALRAHSGAAVNGPNGLISAREALDIEMKKLNVLRDQQAAQFKAIRQREADAKGGDAAVRVKAYLGDSKYATPKEKRGLELEDENKKFAEAIRDLDKNSKDYADALKRHQGNVAQINEQYAHKTRKQSSENGLNAELARITGLNRLIEAEAKRSESALKAQRDAGLIDSETYFQRLHDLQAKALDQQIANAKQRADIASAKKEKSTYETANAEYLRLAEERKKIDTDLTDALAKTQAQRAANVAKFSQQEASALGAQLNQYNDAYNTRNMLADEKATYEARAALARDYERKIAALGEQYSSPAADQREYQDKLRIAGETYRKQTEAFEDNLSRQNAIRESFGEQFKKSYAELVGSSQTTAEAVASGFRGAFDSVSNALDTFITTGKASFSSFATSVLADLAKIALRQAEIGLFKSMASTFSFFSEGGPVGHFASGGAISGPGTGTSDSIPAMLSNGEFVVNAASTKKYRSLLESINSGHMAHFATGGIAATLAPSPAASGGSTPVSVQVNNHGGGGLSEQDAKDLQQYVQSWIDIRMEQRMREQGGFAFQMKYGQI
ncbi:phage tail length tape measure family protein [Burkholderia pseudomallei]|uniref:phage tail length tape measure family protein n=1 Tax=Burkholderia pseudomallei TaxID=28450 RepID=UPI00050DAFF0|nr:phage tail length tape measure family protein [Burkholderia pseudomallei]KGD05975.1 prophage tail length tape measure family protein [Burkholderia pseudomallei]